MLRLYTIKALLQFTHSIHLSFHQRALIIFVDLLDDELRVAPDDELFDSEVHRDPETGKQALVLGSVVS